MQGDCILRSSAGFARASLGEVRKGAAEAPSEVKSTRRRAFFNSLLKEETNDS